VAFDLNDDSTFDTARAVRGNREFGCLELSILCHPDLARIGDRARLLEPGASGKLTVSRWEPEFRDSTANRTRALASQRVSRLPIELEQHANGSVSIRADGSIEVAVEDQRLHGSHTYGVEQLERGILLQLGKYVLLSLVHSRSQSDESTDPAELLGTSSAMRQLRAELARTRELEIPLLLRGEPGVGKRLASVALHRISPRRVGPYVSLDLAELSPRAAATLLFGDQSGATGPIQSVAGEFLAADGGTVFLHHIEAATPELQALLLRALQSGLRRRGASQRAISVRLITASEADLERLCACGQFNPELVRQLGYAIDVPALRIRANDTPQLFAHFLQERLVELGQGGQLAPQKCDRKPPLTAEIMAQLVRHHWPGNVRQLREAARQFAAQQLAESQPRSRAPLQLVERRPAPRKLSEADIVAALAQSEYQIDRTAQVLGVSRSWLHTRIETLPSVRKAKDLSQCEIRAALAATGGELGATALELKVSRKGLQLQMKRLGLDGGLDACRPTADGGKNAS
jgi:two-component system, NtrC family, nitrogen regulation response regulator GlnG